MQSFSSVATNFVPTVDCQTVDCHNDSLLWLRNLKFVILVYFCGKLFYNQMNIYFWFPRFITFLTYLFWSSTISYLYYIYAPVKLFCPHPPGHPRGHHFFCCCPGVLITLIFTCPALYNHQNQPFSWVPRLFLSHAYFLWPRGCPGGDGGWTIWPAHNEEILDCI